MTGARAAAGRQDRWPRKRGLSSCCRNVAAWVVSGLLQRSSGATPGGATVAEADGRVTAGERQVARPPVPGRLAFAEALRPGAIPIDGLEDSPDGLIWAFAFAPDGGHRAVRWDGIATALAEPGGFVWVHLNPATAVARSWMHTTELLAPASVTALEGVDARPHVLLVGDDLVAVMSDLQSGAEAQRWDGTTVRALLDRRVLVTARKRPAQGLRRLHREILDGARMTSTVHLFCRLIELIADGFEAETGRIGADLDLIEEHVLDGDTERMRRPAVMARRAAYRLSRLVRLKRQTIAALAASPPVWFDPPERERFAVALERVSQVADELQSIQDRARAALDEVGARLAEQTNRNTLILSVVTVIFAPLSLITGFFGMNTGNLPLTESESGTVWAVALMLALVGVALVLLRRRGML